MFEQKSENMKIIRPKQLSAMLGISITTLWRLENNNDLPPKIRLGKTAVGWRESDISDWLASREEVAK